jgi:hypothetical protein
METRRLLAATDGVPFWTTDHNHGLTFPSEAAVLACIRARLGGSVAVSRWPDNSGLAG